MATDPSASHMAEFPSFLSLGLVVLDDLHFPNRGSLYGIPGGSGSYATVGARMVAGASRSSTVACIILTGTDFPVDVLEMFYGWGISLIALNVPNAVSTRGRLEYLDEKFGRKKFQYLTPLLQPEVEHLTSEWLLGSGAFHFLARPDDLERRVTALLSRRSQHMVTERPLLVWEPAPLHCNSDNFEAHVGVCQRIDVFSPNHFELISLFEEECNTKGSLSKVELEGYAQRFIEAISANFDRDAKIVVRAGEHGSFIISKVDEISWFPSFFNDASPRVIDPTGAGNAYLGALTLVLQRGGSLREAAMHGTVAASFALEQVGLPLLKNDDTVQTWNGTSFEVRLEQYKRRLE